MDKKNQPQQKNGTANNWLELAVRTRLQAQQHAKQLDLIIAYRDSIRDKKDHSPLTINRLTKLQELIDKRSVMYKTANYTYLGASAASMENKPFTPQSQIQHITEAYHAGHVLHHFVRGAALLAANDSLHRARLPSITPQIKTVATYHMQSGLKILQKQYEQAAREFAKPFITPPYQPPRRETILKVVALEVQRLAPQHYIDLNRMLTPPPLLPR